MDKALDLGINFFDTANVYGGKKGEGVTEKIVGRWFAQADERWKKSSSPPRSRRHGRRPNQSRSPR